MLSQKQVYQKRMRESDIFCRNTMKSPLIKESKTKYPQKMTDVLCQKEQQFQTYYLPQIKRQQRKQTSILDQVKPYVHPKIQQLIKYKQQKLNLQKYDISYNAIKKKVRESSIVLGGDYGSQTKSQMYRSETFNTIFNQ